MRAMAINRRVKDQDVPTFIDLVLWEKQAELAGEYLTKGSKIGVVGRARNEEWDDRESGQKRRKMVFDVEELEFLSKKPEGGEPQAKPSSKRTSQKQQEFSGDDDSGTDDVPF